MGFQEEVRDLTRWYRQMNPAVRGVLKAVLLLILLLISGSFQAALAPFLTVAVWTLISADVRTLPLSALLLAGLAGWVVVLPAAALVETPFMLLAGTEGVWAEGVAAACELLALAAALVVLAWRRETRCRYSAGIADFMLMGLWMGAGLEAGIGILQAGKIGFSGMDWGLWPLFPGMLGRLDATAASMGPSLAGLLAGLLVGLQRYLFGPNLGSRSIQGYALALLAVFAVWLGLERTAFAGGNPSGFGGFLFWLDLKGRLLAYLVLLAGLAALLVEWLLLQEQPAAQPLKGGWRAFREQWQANRDASWRYRMGQLAAWQGRRMRIRELALAADMSRQLPAPDQALLEKRLSEIRAGLQASH